MMKRALFGRQAVKFGLFFAKLALMTTAWAAPTIPHELSKDSLVYCTSGEGFSFSPQKADVGSNMNVVTEQIYDKLIEFDPVSRRLKPALAERFEISEDGLTLTFTLRKNVRFQQTGWFTPTRHFEAEDVLFSLNRVLGNEIAELQQTEQPSRQNKLVERAHFPFFESIDLSSKIASLSAPSRYLVQIHLVKPDKSLLYHLASPFAVMLSKEYALQLNSDDNLGQLDLLPIGTGSYQIESYVANERVRLKPNPHYWGEKPKIKNMIVDFSTSATGRMTKFLNGECDVSAFIEPGQTLLLKEKKGQIIENDGANLLYLGFNFDRPLGEDLNLRHRIAQAIDRERLAKLFFYGTAEVAKQVIPKAMFSAGDIETLPPLAESSSDALDRPLVLWVIDEQRVYHPHPRKMAEFIRSELARAGITIEVKMVSRAYLTQQLDQHTADYDLILGGWLASDFEPTGFLSPILACQSQHSVTNLANWCDGGFESLLAQAEQADSVEKRAELLQRIETLLATELPLFPLLNVQRVLLVNPKVKDAVITPFGQVKLSDMGLQ